MKTPGALPVVVLPVLASALHLDPLLKQVQGADEALGDLVHLGTQTSYTRTLTLEQDTSSAVSRGNPEICPKEPSVRASRFRYLLMNRLKHNY